MDYVGYGRSDIGALPPGLGLITPHQAIFSTSTGLLEEKNHNEDHICLCELKANDATHQLALWAPR